MPRASTDSPGGAKPAASAQDSEVEVEDPARVAATTQLGQESDDRQQDERCPEEPEHDQVRDQEEPLEEPGPAAEVGLQLSFEPHWIGGGGGHGQTSFPVRADRTRRIPPASASAPSASNATTNHQAPERRAASWASTLTLRLPSAFITTADH